MYPQCFLNNMVNIMHLAMYGSQNQNNSIKQGCLNIIITKCPAVVKHTATPLFYAEQKIWKVIYRFHCLLMRPPIRLENEFHK